MALLVPRAKYEVWVKRSVVRAVDVGERSRRAGSVLVYENRK